MRIFKILTLAVAVFAVAAGTVPLLAQAQRGDSNEPGRKIVVFANDLSDEAKDVIIRDVGAAKIKHLQRARASVMMLDRAGLEKLRRNPNVLRIDDDVIVTALETGERIERTARGGTGTLAQPIEVLPWGIERVNANDVWGTTTTDPVKVAILDTGIDLSHPDLKANIKGQYNAISPWQSVKDGNGHGTHVAGIIAAIDNTVGVIGVAPKADLYAVKVLNNNGSGYLSDIIEGLDWAIAKGIKVVNMSLGTVSDIQSFHDAIVRAYNAGIVLVAAAGNAYGGAVNYPAAYSEVIAVSATDSNNNLASFSSVGPQVDIAAPGASIYSTYKNSSYATMSGTSMASPHTAGVAALLLSVPSKCDADASGSCSPAEVQARLETTAHDLDASGKDFQYGSGLVDAYAALQ